MTEKQQLILDFIRAYIRRHGVSPSYEAIAVGLKLRSKSNIHRIVHKLKDDGHLTVQPYKFHSIKVVDRSLEKVLSL
jgi:repressor LexA